MRDSLAVQQMASQSEDHLKLELEAANEKIKEFSALNATLKEEAKGKIQKALEKIKELTTAVSLKSQEVIQLNSQLEEAQHSNTQLNDSLNNLKLQLQERDNALLRSEADWKLRNDTLLDEVTNLQKGAQQLHGLVVNQLSDSQAAETLNEQLTEREQHFLARETEWQREKETLTSRIATLQNESEAIASSTQQQFATFESRVATLEQEKKDLNIQMEALRLDTTTSSTHHDEEISSLHNKIKDLNEQLLSTTSLMESLRQENEVLKSEFSSAAEMHSKKLSEVKEGAKTQLQKALEKIKDLSNAVNAKGNEVQALRQRNETLSSEAEAANDTIKKLLDYKEVTVSDLKQKDSAIILAQGEVRLLQSRIQEVEDMLVALTAEKNIALEERNECLIRCAGLEKALSEVQESAMTEVQNLRAQIISSNSEREGASEAAILALKDQLSKSNSEREELLLAKQDLLKTASDNLTLIDQLKAELGIANDQLIAQAASTSLQKQQLADNLSEIEHQNIELSSLREDFAKANTLILDYSSEINRQKVDLERQSSLLEQQSQELSLHLTSIDRHKQEIESHIRLSNQQKEELVNAHSTISEQLSVISKLQEEVTFLKRNSADEQVATQRELEKSALLISQLSAQLEQKDAELRGEMQARIQSVELELKNATEQGQKERDSYLATISELQENISSLEKDKRYFEEALSQQMNCHRAEIEAKDKLVEEGRETLSKLNEEKSILVAEINSLRADIESKSIYEKRLQESELDLEAKLAEVERQRNLETEAV